MRMPAQTFFGRDWGTIIIVSGSYISRSSNGDRSYLVLPTACAAW